MLILQTLTVVGDVVVLSATSRAMGRRVYELFDPVVVSQEREKGWAVSSASNFLTVSQSELTPTTPSLLVVVAADPVTIHLPTPSLLGP